MYVYGNLNEGGIVERTYGQKIYYDILYERRDPALAIGELGSDANLNPAETRYLAGETFAVPDAKRRLRHLGGVWGEGDSLRAVPGEVRLGVVVPHRTQ
ncbi:MAG: hypothetical protein IIA67_09250, partial [Planctomycetes bacterium]|nr:hypothetical protein [Planctomycetota bacterium]